MRAPSLLSRLILLPLLLGGAAAGSGAAAAPVAGFGSGTGAGADAAGAGAGTGVGAGAGSGTGAVRWLPPLGYSLELLQAYRPPPSPYAAGHRGIDLVATQGASVAAPAAGTVSFAAAVAGRGIVSLRIDARTVVSVEPVEASVEVGSLVLAGQLIGTVATGGHCVADCLHLGVRVDDAYVNPMRFFRSKPQLLPWGE